MQRPTNNLTRVRNLTGKTRLVQCRPRTAALSKARWIAGPISVSRLIWERLHGQRRHVLRTDNGCWETECMPTPLFVEFLGVAETRAPDTVQLSFLGADGNRYSAMMETGILSALAHCLVSSRNRATTHGKVRRQALEVTSFATLVREDGAPALGFQTSLGSEIVLLLPKEFLPAIRRELAELEAETVRQP